MTIFTISIYNPIHLPYQHDLPITDLSVFENYFLYGIIKKYYYFKVKIVHIVNFGSWIRTSVLQAYTAYDSDKQEMD